MFNNKSWMKTDVDFGAPWATFAVAYRSKMGQELMAAFNAMPDKDDPKLYEQAIMNLIRTHRAEYQDCIVMGMRLDSMTMQFCFDIIHPLMPRQFTYMIGHRRRLETCPICGKELHYEKCYLRQIQAGVRLVVEEVCSEECAKS